MLTRELIPMLEEYVTDAENGLESVLKRIGSKQTVPRILELLSDRIKEYEGVLNLQKKLQNLQKMYDGYNPGRAKLKYMERLDEYLSKTPLPKKVDSILKNARQAKNFLKTALKGITQYKTKIKDFEKYITLLKKNSDSSPLTLYRTFRDLALRSPFLTHLILSLKDQELKESLEIYFDEYSFLTSFLEKLHIYSDKDYLEALGEIHITNIKTEFWEELIKHLDLLIPLFRILVREKIEKTVSHASEVDEIQDLIAQYSKYMDRDMVNLLGLRELYKEGRRKLIRAGYPKRKKSLKLIRNYKKENTDWLARPHKRKKVLKMYSLAGGVDEETKEEIFAFLKDNFDDAVKSEIGGFIVSAINFYEDFPLRGARKKAKYLRQQYWYLF